jgi:hypothetical protein
MNITEREQFKVGKLAEYQFAVSLCEALSYDITDVVFATPEQDMREHWDLMVGKEKIDVKALRKLNRSDKHTNEDFHWVEIKNVNGDFGWLYGEADIFAFELNRCYVLVKREALQEFIKIACKDKKPMTNRELYHIFRRENRKDVMTLVKSLDLVAISEYIIKK